jgi:hypothetical protein
MFTCYVGMMRENGMKANYVQIELEQPGTEWKTHNAWFVRQTAFNTRFRPRQVSP